MTFRFLHLADLHLDSAYGGSSDTVERLRQASLEALTSAANLAIEAKLDAVLIAGDAFDDERLGYASRAILRRELERLGDHGVTVVYITGNHDPGAAGGRAASLRLGRTRNRGAHGVHGAPIHSLLDGTPAVLRLRDRSGEDAAEVVAAGHGTSRVTDNLARAIRRRLEEEPLDAALPKIGLLHTQVGTATGADGHRAYAPCSVADLLACDLDYWALGHVHVRGRVDPAVPAYYPGNLQGRNARESGPKGGLLVELDRDGLENEPEFIPLAPVEFFRCSGELGPRAEPESVAEVIGSALDQAAAEGRGPWARELIIRFDHLGPERSQGLAPEFALGVREELQRTNGPQFGEFIEVQVVPHRRAAAGAPDQTSDLDRSREILDRIERAPSALREALAVCRERDAGGPPTLERALIARLLETRRG